MEAKPLDKVFQSIGPTGTKQHRKAFGGVYLETMKSALSDLCPAWMEECLGRKPRIW